MERTKGTQAWTQKKHKRWAKKGGTIIRRKTPRRKTPPERDDKHHIRRVCRRRMLLLQKKAPKGSPVSPRYLKGTEETDATHHLHRLWLSRSRPQPRRPRGHNRRTWRLRGKENVDRPRQFSRCHLLENFPTTADPCWRTNPLWRTYIRIFWRKGADLRICGPSHYLRRRKTNQNDPDLISHSRRPYFIQYVVRAPLSQLAGSRSFHATPRPKVPLNI